MRYQNNLERKVEKEYKKREKRKRPRVKVSGKNVFRLRDLMQKRG